MRLNQEIAGFILQWRFQLRKEKVPRNRWRERIAERYRATAEYQRREWTTEMFIETWELLEDIGRIFI
jgi:hypothetical protein